MPERNIVDPFGSNVEDGNRKMLNSAGCNHDYQSARRYDHIETLFLMRKKMTTCYRLFALLLESIIQLGRSCVWAKLLRPKYLIDSQTKSNNSMHIQCHRRHLHIKNAFRFSSPFSESNGHWESACHGNLKL